MNQKTTLPLDQLREIRIQKIKKLAEKGISSFPQPTITRENISSILSKKVDENTQLVGRIIAKRGHGKLMFFDVKDFSGKIQLVLKSDSTEVHSMDLAEILDIGDFVHSVGKTYKTEAGQFSVLVESLTLLTKSIRPLPNKWEGFIDQEEKYRQRYVDMILDEKTFSTLVTRSKIVQLFRQFFLKNDFYEVNTPTLQEVYGGASAQPFITHHNALDSDFFLRISPELYLKRLIVGGFEKVFEFTINFRNEGIGRWHNPEFQNIEFYWAYSTYDEMMDFTRDMFRFVVKELTGELVLKYGEETIDFSKDFEKVSFRDALIKHAGIDFEKYKTEEELRSIIQEKKLLEPKDLATKGYSNLLDILYKRTTRPNLKGPLFLIDYPAEMIALAKRKENDKTKIATFQLLILGEEFVKAYNELNDPIDQKTRWEESEKQALAGVEDAERMDSDYVRALEYGMPPTAGWGLGLERTIALLTNNHSVKDVMFFPTLRPIKKENKPSQNTKISTEKFSNYCISDAVKNDFNGISFAYCYLKAVNIEKTNPELENEKELLLKKVAQLTTEDINKISSIVSYRSMFKKTGTDFHSNRPSPEALLRRVILGKGLYKINTAVDAYNLAVLETNIGLGGFDLSKIKEPVVLRYSQKGEKMLLLGDNSETVLRDGQLIYSDADKPITMDLNYRDINATKITEKTKDIILFADGGDAIDKQDVLSALKKGAEYINKYCGGTISELFLVE